MRPFRYLTCLAALTLISVAEQARSATPPTSLQWAGLGHCVWQKLSAHDRAVLVTAEQTGEGYTAAANRIDLRNKSFALAQSCLPAFHQDEARAGKIVGLGLGQETIGDLIARDLGLNRVRLESAISTAPEALKELLRKMGVEVAAGQKRTALLPSMKPIFDALGLKGTESAKQDSWVKSYVLDYFVIQAWAQGAPLSKGAAR